MANNTIVTTRERGILIKTRIGETSVSKSFIFRNEDGTPHSISFYDFEMLLKQQPGASNNLVRLTVGNGLTVSGDDDNELSFQLTATQARQKPNVYFGLIRSQEQDGTWFNFDWEFFNGKFPGTSDCDDEEITICLNGENMVVSITSCGVAASIDGGSAISNYQSDQIINGGNA